LRWCWRRLQMTTFLVYFLLVNKILWTNGGNLISMLEWTWGDTDRKIAEGMFRNFIESIKIFGSKIFYFNFMFKII
jgi:hypothetical protein